MAASLSVAEILVPPGLRPCAPRAELQLTAMRTRGAESRVLLVDMALDRGLRRRLAVLAWTFGGAVFDTRELPSTLFAQLSPCARAVGPATRADEPTMNDPAS
jgi:hypothetical protein